MLTCASCGRDNPDDARFGNGCGSALEATRPAGQEVRKAVTILFTDMVGSTSLAERVDTESMRKIVASFFDALTDVIERHGGTVEKFIGDAVLAVFGIPRAHEDDALRAVRAAAEVEEALADLSRDVEGRYGATLQTRTGVNTGEVVAGDAASRTGLVTGDTVNVAARLQAAASPGEILIGSGTFAMVRDSVTAVAIDPLHLKGKRDPVQAYVLRNVRPSGEGPATRSDSPLVGRETQLRQLREAFAAATDSRSCHLFTVLGGAGVGKSRLVEEFVAGLEDDATVLRGRCLSYGGGITFWPLSEAITRAAGVAPLESPATARAKIAALMAAV